MRQGMALAAANGFHAFNQIGAAFARDQYLVFLPIVDCRGHGERTDHLYAFWMRQRWHHVQRPKTRRCKLIRIAEDIALLRFFQLLDAHPINRVNRHTIGRIVGQCDLQQPQEQAVNPRLVWQASRGDKRCRDRKHAQRILAHAVTCDNLRFFFEIEIIVQLLVGQRSKLDGIVERIIGRTHNRCNLAQGRLLCRPFQHRIPRPPRPLWAGLEYPAQPACRTRQRQSLRDCHRDLARGSALRRPAAFPTNQGTRPRKDRSLSRDPIIERSIIGLRLGRVIQALFFDAELFSFRRPRRDRAAPAAL